MDDVLTEVLGSAEAARAYRDADEDGRMALIERFVQTADGPADAPRMIILNQIVDGSDPHAEPTARRLMEEGLSPERAIGQMAAVLAQVLLEALEAADPFDDGSGEHPGGRAPSFDVERYHRALDGLPLPAVTEVIDVLLAIAADAVVIDGEELLQRAADRLGVGRDDTAAVMLIDRVEDSLGEGHGPLVWLADDRTVSAPAIAHDMVLTHRLGEEEVRTGCLAVDFDLAGFAWADAPTVDGQDLDPHLHDEEGLWWQGPAGWLEGHAAGEVVAVALDADQRVTLTTVQVEEPGAGIVAQLRAAYDAELGEAGLPVPGRDLLAALRVADRGALSVAAGPQPPLTDLCAAAGLDRRGDEVAHDAAVWHEARRLADMHAIRDAVDDDGLADAAIAVIHVCDVLREGGELTTGQVAAVLDDLADLDVLTLVEGALLDVEPSEGPRTTDVLRGVATRPRHVAAVGYLAAVQAEHDGDVEAAEAHLQAAVDAMPDFPPATDRLAWYASDRGDATRAVRLWRRIPTSATGAADLTVVARFADGEVTMNRNDPCSCGSGRKYKRCHLGKPQHPTLADRAGWVWRKAEGYVERGGAAAMEDLWRIVSARLDREPLDWSEVLADPLVIDLALVEAGWFQLFLAARGPLLPDDELILAADWLESRRALHRVTEVVPGRGLALEDVATGVVTPVRERTLSSAGGVSVGDLLLARVVPDGEGHQMVGAVIPLEPGEEVGLRATLATGDALAIAAAVGAIERGQVAAEEPQPASA